MEFFSARWDRTRCDVFCETSMLGNSAAGKVEKIVCAEGQAVNEGDVLLTLA